MVQHLLAAVSVCFLAIVIAWNFSKPPSSTVTPHSAAQSAAAAIAAPLSNQLAKSQPYRIADAAFEQHIKLLKKRLPHQEFHIVIQKPFAVIGDEAPDVVKTRAERTIKWAVDLLKQEYFKDDPRDIIDVWLFKNKESYEEYNEKLFGSPPTTPFGFYSSTNKALVMNIKTGGGTLVHEIVHPFIESNFPECPAWFNEGLASLYEQCGEKNSRIWGQTNWRLRGLQGTIASDRLGSFEELCATTSREFYHDDRGTNYAQARYLCYYLQQKGLLHDFYHDFRKSVDLDPTGYRTLTKTLGNPDMEEFNRQWQEYVLNLRF